MIYENSQACLGFFMPKKSSTLVWLILALYISIGHLLLLIM